MLPTLACLGALVVLFSYRLLWTLYALARVVRRGLAKNSFYRLHSLSAPWRGWKVEISRVVRRRPAQDAFRFYEQRVHELLQGEVCVSSAQFTVFLHFLPGIRHLRITVAKLRILWLLASLVFASYLSLKLLVHELLLGEVCMSLPQQDTYTILVLTRPALILHLLFLPQPDRL